MSKIQIKNIENLLLFCINKEKNLNFAEIEI